MKMGLVIFIGFVAPIDCLVISTLMHWPFLIRG
ncbi:hypothetical protein [Klebsiella phage RothC]|uniref:Uncharacterized protein n=2 Tax=Viruses TaxID=10239 RepID=A0AB39BYX1_9CAUD